MAKAKEAAQAVPTFESALRRLEEIVQCLEAGDTSLEESLTLFEEGVKLAKLCSGQLDAAEGKLQILLGFEGKEPKTGEFKINAEGI
jgi:exodeoxyribonuclease VII small subunit